MDSVFQENNLICPECFNPLNKESCSCGWVLTVKNGIPVLLSNHDKKSEVFSKYLGNYDTIAQDDLSNSIQQPEYLEIQSQKLFEYIAPLAIEGKTLLEIGVGQGILLKKILKANPAKYIALDISMDYLKNLTKNEILTPILANAENIPFKEKFDIVVATDVLEHVLNVGDFLVSLNRCVKKGGMAIIRVPYMENLIQYSKLNGCPYEFVHLRTFDDKTLIDTLAVAGFKNLKLHHDGFQIYRLRDCWTKYKSVRMFITEKLLDFFRVPTRIATIDNRLGRIFMKPLEITIIATKTHDI